MNAPRWLLLLIWALECGILVVQLYRRQWVDAIYWLGVMLINVGIFARMTK